MASPLWLLMTPCFMVGLWDVHRVSCGCGKPGCQQSFNPGWEMRPGLKWGEVGLSLGWGPWGTWQPSPCEALSLASCQIPAPPPLTEPLSFEFRAEGPGCGLFLPAPDSRNRVVSHLVPQHLRGVPGPQPANRAPRTVSHLSLQPPSSY